jgi:phosphoserine phosphatase
MQETVITIVGNITPALENQAMQCIKAVGIEDLRLEVLSQNKAVDIIVGRHNPELTKILFDKTQNLGNFDIFIQANDDFRKKKLLLADMDATIILQETLDELAAHFNLKDKVSAITERAMRGELDFHEALKARVKLLKGLPMTALFETLRRIEYSVGAGSLVKTMNRHGAKCVLVSGGFDIFTSHVAVALGFYKNFGNQLGIENGVLTGEVIPPIVDKDVKEQQIITQAKLLPCDLKHVIAIGDGANDIPMLKRAGVGVGYFGKPAVLTATPHQIRHTDLVSVLYLQGYKQTEIVL